jgi:transposase, IS5 family
VDKGYQGVKIEGIEIMRSGQRRVTRAMIKRRSAIEPAIGHMKMDGRSGRNPLKGAVGDALHAVMCGAGHNMRSLLRKLRLLCVEFGAALQEILRLTSLQPRPVHG